MSKPSRMPSAFRRGIKKGANAAKKRTISSVPRSRRYDHRCVNREDEFLLRMDAVDFMGSCGLTHV